MVDYHVQGFDALNYEEHLDYELVQSTNPEFNKVPHTTTATWEIITNTGTWYLPVPSKSVSVGSRS